MMTGEHKDKDSSNSVVEQWLEPDIPIVYELEVKNWAPWLVASSQVLQERLNVFPQGQLLVRDEQGKVIASLTTNRVNWSNYPDPKGLPKSWDWCAGKVEGVRFQDAYDQKGSSLVLLSMNVDPGSRGQHLPSRLIEAAKEQAKELGVSFLISPFRPSSFGDYKLEKRVGNEAFWDFCNQRREDGKLRDPWLRSLEWSGGRLICECPNAMAVQVSIDVWGDYKQNFRPERWREISPGKWECGETGSWEVDEESKIATYRESNVWGVIEVK